jgi:hypothetical protein
MSLYNVSILPLLALLFTCNIVFSQDENFSTVHRVGFQAGTTTGVGFSYKYQPSKFGLQLVSMPIFDGDGNVLASFGLSGLYRFTEFGKIDFFGYLGNHIFIGRTDWGYHVGVGAGIDWHVWPSVLDLNFQAGYGVYYLNDRPFSLLTGEIGIHYLLPSKQPKQQTRKPGGL